MGFDSSWRQSNGGACVFFSGEASQRAFAKAFRRESIHLAWLDHGKRSSFAFTIGDRAS